MNKLIVAVMLGLLAASAAEATPEVLSVSVRQRWPWSEKVDVDVVVNGEGTCDLDVSATWSGRSEPLKLTPLNGLSGRTCSIAAGQCRFVWDPAQAGIAEPLANFRLTVEAVDSSAREYLVIDLTDGSFEYLAEPPEGGFNVDLYKTTKMAFRRIAARTFTMGLTSAVNNKFKSLVMTNKGVASSSYNSYAETWSPHKVTLTDDFYMALFRVTAAQYSYVTGAATKSTSKVQKDSLAYTSWRGTTNGTDGVNWPLTGYRVTPTSFFGKFRALVKDALLLDMPTDAQWELAARNGKDTIYDIGGGSDMTWESFLELEGRAASTSTTAGGSVGANENGLYDMLGVGNEMCLDQWIENLGTSAVVDPIGATTKPMTRIMHGEGKSEAWRIIPVKRKNLSASDTKSSSYGALVVRPTIHLRKLVD